MADYTNYTNKEMQAITLAKCIHDGQIAIVGTGLPLIGASVAKRLFAPKCNLIVESGLMDCAPIEVPRSVGDLRFMAHCGVQWPNVRFIGFEANEWLHDNERLIAFIGGALYLHRRLSQSQDAFYRIRRRERYRYLCQYDHHDST